MVRETVLRKEVKTRVKYSFWKWRNGKKIIKEEEGEEKLFSNMALL